MSNDTEYSRSLRVRKHRLAYYTQHGGSRYLINPFTLSFCEVNEDMLTILSHMESVCSIHELFERYGLPDSFDQALAALISKGIVEIVGAAHENVSDSDLIGFPEPTCNHIAIFPTHNCNLACTYCYACGGDEKTEIAGRTIDIAFDYFFNQVVRADEKQVSLDFHGGGEPTVAFEKIRYALARFAGICKERGLNYSVNMATNACFNAEILSWLIENNVELTVSFDGLEDIQNRQRPFRTGKASYDIVVKNIEMLISGGASIGVRSTITRDIVERMPDIVRNIHSLGVSSIHFEPCFEIGRCEETQTEQPAWDDFVQFFLESFDVSLQLGANLRFSGLRCMDQPKNHFCGACGTNFAVTPEGYLTACYEVVRKADPASAAFFFGRIDTHSGKVEINNAALDRLRNRTVHQIEQCSDCFLKWGCAGDCPVKAYRDTGSLFEVSTDRCNLVRSINQRIVSMITEEEFQPFNRVSKFVYRGGDK